MDIYTLSYCHMSMQAKVSRRTAIFTRFAAVAFRFLPFLQLEPSSLSIAAFAGFSFSKSNSDPVIFMYGNDQRNKAAAYAKRRRSRHVPGVNLLHCSMSKRMVIVYPMLSYIVLSVLS
jgi:hypothetical protein